MALFKSSLVLIVLLVFGLLPHHAHGFGAGNIAHISEAEGRNWRHGDIEDVLKTLACIKGHKWTSMMIKRVYFGNWLRDYSQAMDTAALKKAQPEAIRILVWILSFLGFGYATAEFEVTTERLGVYRPEEHIDNPKDYADNEDARPYDPRLRPPVRPIELQIDPETGMKNYIANGKGDWATSAAFVKYSFDRSIHHGRLYASGHGFFKGKDEDLAEALRYLGQGLHTLEDFGAHTNYVELSLRELGFHNVFAHTGTNTMINLLGKHVFPLVTGTFGTVDFYHSVLGEATDHFTQSEVHEMDNALSTAQTAAQSSHPVVTLVNLLSKVPGTRDLCIEAEQLQRAADIQARENSSGLGYQEALQWVTRNANTDSGMARALNDAPGAGRYGAAEHDTTGVSQPDWSGLQVADAQNNHHHQQQQQQPSWGQQQEPAWNQPQQSWNRPPEPQWSQNQQNWNQPQQFGSNQHSGQTPQFSSMEQSGQPQQYSSGQQWAPWSEQGPPPAYGDHSEPNFNEQQAAMGTWEGQPSTNPTHESFTNNPQQPSGLPQHHDAIANVQTTPSVPQQTPVSDPGPGLPGLPNFDPAKTIQQIYPILAFRDKVVRAISAVIEMIPGLEALVERITETLTIFVMSLLAPFVRPVISALTKTLQLGSAEVIGSSALHQYEPWTDPNCTDPTHSLLSKDHFSNILNQPAGLVAAEILKYVAPRVLNAWQNRNLPVERVLDECMHVFHHPAIRDSRLEVHRTMFDAVQKWVQSRPDRGGSLNDVLSREGVRAGKNLSGGQDHAGYTHNNAAPSFGDLGMPSPGFGGAHHAPQPHGGFDPLAQLSSLPIPGLQNVTARINRFSSLVPGGFGTRSREASPSGRSGSDGAGL